MTSLLTVCWKSKSYDMFCFCSRRHTKTERKRDPHIKKQKSGGSRMGPGERGTNQSFAFVIPEYLSTLRFLFAELMCD